MPLERLVARTRRRLARGAFASLLRSAQAGSVAATAGPQGSGSWANDWSETGSMMERAMSLALPDRRRPAAMPPVPDPAAPDPAVPDCNARKDGQIRTKPLMSLHEVRLHNWIADRLEAEAPTCSLHARVACAAFLTSDPAEGVRDPLHRFVADMLIADQNGQPVAALMRATAGSQARQTALLRKALRDADLPVIDLPVRPGLADLWAEIARTLPKD